MFHGRDIALERIVTEHKNTVYWQIQYPISEALFLAETFRISLKSSDPSVRKILAPDDII
jgi:hypothetical protein